MSPTSPASTSSSNSQAISLSERTEQSDNRQGIAVLNDSNHFKDDSFVDYPDRIAEALRGLSLRRRQSIDTVRSSEFGEGGRWDRAWTAGSDDEEDYGDDEENFIALANIDIDGGINHNFGQDKILNNSREGTLPTPHYSTISKGQITALHNASSSMQKRLPSGGRSQQPVYLGPDNLQRRGTIKSIVGDTGGEASSPKVNSFEENSSIGQNDWNGSTQSFSSDHSQQNSHVHVWPPTPAGSDLGGGHAGSDGSDHGRGMLQINPIEVGKSQYAEVEYYQPSRETREENRFPLSPSAALAQPLHDPMASSPGSYTQSQTSNQRQIPDRAPLHSSTKLNLARAQDDGYSDPNKPLPSMQYSGLGETRRQAIEDHDGRESLVSDLDVETLRLDGSEDSRRDSTSTIGSFSSGLIREQRQRRSDATLMTNSDKRSSAITINEAPSKSSTRGIQHRSWNNNVQREGEDGKNRQTIRPPVRSNTGPDSVSTISNSNSNNLSLNNNHGVTFSTTKTDRDGKKSGVIIKGATQQTEAEKFLTLAITHHESGDLSRSAYYFERSAKVEGGCVVGMCMWGMALREGWGIKRDQKKGFDWISKAATKAGEMMASGNGGGGKNESEIKAIRSELKLSVYELGKCFCYGWGVKMDKQMSLEYFELAAKLGDADAQAEAGALLAAGKGCKKDLKKAATYYRMAESQGYDTVGLSWIHKAKYD